VEIVDLDGREQAGLYLFTDGYGWNKGQSSIDAHKPFDDFDRAQFHGDGQLHPSLGAQLIKDAP
jgi:hypothetical protein